MYLGFHINILDISDFIQTYFPTVDYNKIPWNLFRFCTICIPISLSKDLFVIEAFATSFHVFWSLLTTYNDHKLPTGFWCKNCPPWPNAVCHYTGNFWPHIGHVTFHTQLPILHHGSSNPQTQHDCRGALLQDRNKPGPSDMSFLQEGLPPLSLVSCYMPEYERR